MKCNVDDIALWHNKRNVLDRHLGRIRRAFFAEDIAVRQLIADQDGTISSTRAEELARRITDVIDDLQKPYYYAAKMDLWRAIEDYEDGNYYYAKPVDELFEEFINGVQLDKIPPTLDYEQRQLTEDLIYCALYVTSCEALGDNTLGNVYELLRETSQLLEPKGRAKSFDYEQLVRAEYDVQNKKKLGQRTPKIKAIFGDMDCLYELLYKKYAIELVSNYEIDKFIKSAQLAQDVLEFPTDSAADDYSYGSGIGIAASMSLYDTWGKGDFRLLTTDPNTMDAYSATQWENLDSNDRIARILEGLDCLDTSRLLNESDTRKMRKLLDDNPVFFGWRNLDGEAARDLIKAGFMRVAFDSEEQQKGKWAEYRRRAAAYYVIEWGKFADTADLFCHYQDLRKNISNVPLPDNKFDKLWDKRILWYPEGFDELARIAFDAVLNEEGYSYIFDDDMFHTTYAYIRETAYQMELASDRRRAQND